MATEESLPLSTRLAQLASEVGGAWNLDDDGDTVEASITIPGKGSVFADAALDDGADLAAQLRAELAQKGWLSLPKHEYRLTYSNGRTVAIRAADEAQAIRLVGQGQPEEITEVAHE